MRSPTWVITLFVFATGAIAVGALGALMSTCAALDPVGVMLADDHNPDPQLPNVDESWASAAGFGLLVLAGIAAFVIASRSAGTSGSQRYPPS